MTKSATIAVSNEKQVDWYTFQAVFVQLTTPSYLNLDLKADIATTTCTTYIDIGIIVRSVLLLDCALVASLFNHFRVLCIAN